MVEVQSIHCYPTKSCRGYSSHSLKALEAGFAGDRQMMVTKLDGTFLSQRSYPLMSQVEIKKVRDEVLIRYKNEDFFYSYEPVGAHQVKVWGDEILAADLGDKLANKVSQILGTPVRLVEVSSDTLRVADKSYTERDVHYGFADGFPYLITSDASLSELNQRIESKGDEPVPMESFRPNIVLSGLKPYQEDEIKRIRIGEAIFRLVKPCTRCRITCVDIETLAIRPEPLRTLGEYRYDEKLKGVCFGQNAYLESGFGYVIRQGDEAFILD